MKSKFIRLAAAQCHNCMRCVRACPTFAMTYIHNEPVIDAEDCILCGRCYMTCPHDAKSLLSELKDVQRWISGGQEVILSVAPSFAAVWPHLKSLERILMKRGFSAVDETAKGAALVSQAYANLIEEHQMKNIITTCCPTVNALIEKEYGDLTEYMAPVISPMIAHGRMIKKEHPGAKVVFFSPCIAKFKEIEDARFAGAVDACIGMEELVDWIRNDLQEDEKEDWNEFEGSIARLYPTAGGIINTLPQNANYRYAAVDGIERIRNMLESIRAGKVEGYFLEVNACQGSCMQGPLLSHFMHNEWTGQTVIRENISLNAKIQPGPLPFDMSAEWKKENIYRPKHTEEEIKAQMAAMGKTSPMKIHDCGACGYETCRLKAIAVLDGKADPKICLPEALERAQSLSNVVLDNTPNGIIVVDKDLTIREMNQAGRKLLNLDMINPTGMPLMAVLPNDELTAMVSTVGRKAQFLRAYYDMYEKLFEHSVVKVRNDDLIVIILMDRTEEEAREQEIKEMREHTLTLTQKVIDEQMRAVQEIASLLGETTARSKIALHRLQRVMEGNEDETIDSH